MQTTIKIFTDLVARSKINSLPESSKKRIINCLNSSFEIEIIDAFERIKECEVYFGDLIEANYVRKMNNLKWIHFSSTGVDRALIPEIINSDIKVSYSPDAFTNSVLVLTLGYICNFARGLNTIFKLRANNQLSRREFDYYSSNISDLIGEKILIVGYGRIGRKLGSVLSLLGMKVYVIKTTNKINDSFIEDVFLLDQLEDAVKNKLFIVNLLPFTQETFEVFNKSIFKAMNNKSYFINVGRGKTVDENSLIEALHNKEIAGAALDVFYNEPLSLKSELLSFENVLITPHVGNINKNYWEYETNLFIKNLKHYVKGENLHSTLDIIKGY